MEKNEAVCGESCEVFSRVVGYYRPVMQWNLGKREEFKDRKEYGIQISLKSKFATQNKPTVCKC